MSDHIDIYLDNMAVNYLFEYPKISDPHRVRKRLTQAVDSGRVTVVGADMVMGELLGSLRSSRKKFEWMRDYYLQLTKRSMLLQWNERIAKEVVCGRKLTREELFCPKQLIREMRHGLRQASTVSLADDFLYTRKKEYKRFQEEQRGEARLYFESRRKDGMTNLTWTEEERETTVGEYVRNYLRRAAAEFGIEKGHADQTDPRSTVTLWHFWSFALSRIFLYVTKGRRIDESDRNDTYHYSAGPYADFIVSDDRRLLETHQSIPERMRPCRVIDFDEFVGLL